MGNDFDLVTDGLFNGVVLETVLLDLEGEEDQERSERIG